MCKEIYQYKESYQNDFSCYFNLKDIDRDAEELNEKIRRQIPNLYRNAISAIEVAKYMGFQLFLTEFEDPKLSGMIGISKDLISKFHHDKVIILNKKDTDKHILFTVIHELAHYIYDYNPYVHTKGYFDKYKTDEVRTDKEMRANRFAAAFMMPANRFKEAYLNNKNASMRFYENINQLSDEFRMPRTAVELRINELDLIRYGNDR